MLQIEGWKRVLIWAVVVAGIVLSLPNLFYSRVETHNDAVRAIDVQGQVTETLAEARGAWPGWLPSGLVNLGLDLRGGAHLLAEVQVQDVYEARIDSLWPDLRNALRDVRGQVGGVRRLDAPAGTLRVRIANPDAMGAAMQAARSLSTPVGGMTGGGQSNLAVSSEGDVLTVQLSEAAQRQAANQAVSQAVEIIRRRIDETGTREPTIQREGDARVLIQVPGLGSAAELKSLIGTTAQLTFHPVVGRADGAQAQAGPGNSVMPSANQENTFFIVEDRAVVSGEQLTDAQPTFDDNNRPAVNFRFNPQGARAFGDYTAANIGEPFAIVLDGEVISAPVIQSHIPGGSGIITGDFTVEESNELAVLLRAGALPAGLTFLEERTIGPQLGQDSIEAGSLASIVAFVALLVIMALSYGRFGLFANAALIVNMCLLFGILSLIGATLTLPGIAGIVLTLGMAVDANVLVFERIREEMRTARGPARAIELGYERALSAIIDANTTTFLIAVILYTLGSGPVRGFAVTLGLGILTSVFTAIFVTRLLMIMWFERARPKTIEV